MLAREHSSYEMAASEGGEESDFSRMPMMRRFFADTPHAFISLLRGPIGCGKTHGLCKYLQNYIVNLPVESGVISGRILCIRNTADMLRTTTVATFLQAWPKSIPCRYIRSGAGGGNFYAEFPVVRDGVERRVELEVLFRAYELERSMAGFLGMEISAVFANEVNQLPRGVVETAMTRTNRWPREIPAEKRRLMAVCDSNSFDRGHSLYSLFYERASRERLAEELGVSAHNLIRTYDYPGGMSEGADYPPGVDYDWYRNLRAARNDEAWSRIFIDNEFGAEVFGDRCYKEFSRAVHVREVRANGHDALWLAMDGGKDSAFLLFQQTAAGAAIVDEMVFQREDLEKCCEVAADYFASKYPPRTEKGGYRWSAGCCDPGLDSTSQWDSVKFIDLVNSAFTRKGLPAFVKAATNEVDARISVVNRHLRTLEKGHPCLVVSDACEWTARAMEMYHYRRMNVRTSSGDERYAPAPEKTQESHAAEAVAYGLLRPQDTRRAADIGGRSLTTGRPPRKNYRKPGVV